ncbi:autotransporter assembly complex protein TamA [Ancylobacter terrae]|uniref:autotransporter assembly complex protein TamA n=1 Tax=Ancylobacter sp. sgz301288 TaxID=3342077 RepID=UPI00385B660B
MGTCVLFLAAGTARAQDAGFLESITSLFNPERAAAAKTPAIDATPYALTLNVKGGDKEVREAVEEASNLVTLKASAPSGAAGLVRRALSDAERITAALYDIAHYSGVIQIRVAGLSPDDPRVFDAIEAARRSGPVPVVLDVDPGPAFTFGTVRILDARNRRPFADAPSYRTLKLEPGQPALASLIVAAENTLVTFWRDKGHPFAKVADKDIVADHARHRLDVTLLVDPGPHASFGRFIVSGTKGLQPGFVEERIDIAPGEPFSPDRLAKLRKRLLTYPIIGGVRFREGDKLDANGQLPINVEITEREPRYVGFSANYSSTDGSSIGGYWGHRNLFGGGETLRLDAQVSWFGQQPEAVPDADPFGYRVAASFTKPGIITANDDLVATAAVLREVTNAYVREGATFLGGIRHRYSDDLSLQVGIDLEQSHVEDAQGTGDYTVVGIPIDVAYDTTDNTLDPSRGIRASATVEPFAYLGDAGAGPVMMRGSIAAYRALDDDKRYILAGRVGAGSIVGASLYDVPPQRRFYVGGGGSLRGYDYQSASPRDAEGNIIGGLSYFEGSAELRIRLTDTIGVVPFFDMGAAFASETPDFDGLKYAAGIGLRYYTAIGPLRLDLAFPLNPSPGDGTYGIYVSLGQSF